MSDQGQPDDDLSRLPTDEELLRLQRTTVLYYLQETNPDNGLVRDKTHPDAPCSIAAIGLALATIPVIVERGVVIRRFAAKIARRRLRSLLASGGGGGGGGWTPAGEFGSASLPTLAFRGHAHLRQLFRPEIPTTRPRSAAWRTHSTVGLTGIGWMGGGRRQPQVLRRHDR